MPLDSDQVWNHDQVLSGEQLLSILRQDFGALEEISRPDPTQPAEEFRIGNGRIGIIRSVTAPFCGACNRIRITADGAIRNCLFAQTETPLRVLLREGASNDELMAAIRGCLSEKSKAHGINEQGFQPPDRPMYAIGG